MKIYYIKYTMIFNNMRQNSDERQGKFKLLRDLLNKHPDSRCAKSSECMSMITQRNSRTVYGIVRISLM